MYARVAVAQAPYAGFLLPAPEVGTLPPPIPGDSATFSYATNIGAYPWALFTWAGGPPPQAYPGGGIVATALPDQGIIQLTLWWPNAPSLSVARVTVDGARTAVRGAAPLIVTVPTRRNYANNPSIEVGTNGFVPDAGSPTLTQLADATAPDGANVLRATVAGAGSNGVTVPTALLTPGNGSFVTVGWGMRTSARPTTVTLTISWTDALGGALSTNTATLTADQINASVATWARQVLTVAPPNTAVTPTVKIVAAGMPAGGTMDLDAFTIEIGTTSGSYFAGNTLGAIWNGTVGLSTSALAPILTLYDGEAPLDTLLYYQISYPGLTGGRVVSDPLTLLSGGASWLSHPNQITNPITVALQEVPKLERSIADGVFWPLAGTFPLVVASTRRAPSGSLNFVWLTFAERDALLAFMADGAPLLLRTAHEFGGENRWLALHNVTEDRGDRKAYQDAGLLAADFHEVARPSL